MGGNMAHSKWPLTRRTSIATIKQRVLNRPGSWLARGARAPMGMVVRSVGEPSIAGQMFSEVFDAGLTCEVGLTTVTERRIVFLGKG